MIVYHKIPVIKNVHATKLSLGTRVLFVSLLKRPWHSTCVTRDRVPYTLRLCSDSGYPN